MCMKFRKFWIESWESYLNYFQNYILQKSWLLKRLKDLASEHHSVNNALTVSNTAEISRHYYFPYFSMNLASIELEKVFVSSDVILRLFVNSLTADNKYSHCNLHILKQIQTPLSLKQKHFLIFYCSSEMCMKI